MPIAKNIQYSLNILIYFMQLLHIFYIVFTMLQFYSLKNFAYEQSVTSM